MRDYRLYVKDIVSAIDSIHEFVAGMDSAAFQADDKTASTVMRKLEIIGIGELRRRILNWRGAATVRKQTERTHLIAVCQQAIAEMERKHGMNFEQFTRYTAGRTAHLRNSTDLSPDECRILGEEIMHDEDDWLDWKVSEEILQGSVAQSG